MTQRASKPASGISRAPKAYLEVHDSTGKSWRESIDAEHTIIGRSETVPTRLKSETVSRKHAEVFCDPFGRWWIRDLGSSNGTRVNGREVSEIMLSTEDEIEIGEYLLRLIIPERRTSSSTSDTAFGSSATIALHVRPERAVPMADTDVEHISTLREVGTPQIETAHLDVLNEFAREVSRIEIASERLEQFCRLLVSPEFCGKAAVAVRLDKTDTDVSPQLLCEPQHRGGLVGDVPYLSRTLLRVLRANETPVVASQGSNDGGIEMTIVSGQQEAMAAVACPIRITNEELDLIYVSLPAEFGTGAWLTLLAHATQTYTQVESVVAARHELQAKAVMERDLARASEIQLGIVPTSSKVAGLDVAIGFEPCRWVGGDYADLVQTKDGRVVLAVADVSGKGLPAAMVSQTVHAMVHLCQRTGGDLMSMMTSLNDHLCEFLDDRSFVTMVCMTIDPKTGAYELINAGHPSPLVISPDGEVRELQNSENFPLGLVPQEIVVERGQLERQHLVALFTDGLTELTDENDKELGPQKIAQMMKDMYLETRDKPGLDSMAVKLRAALDAILANRTPLDDRTFLLARRV